MNTLLEQLKELRYGRAWFTYVNPFEVVVATYAQMPTAMIIGWAFGVLLNFILAAMGTGITAITFISPLLSITILAIIFAAADYFCFKKTNRRLFP